MRIAVIGAGIVGVATAHELALAGFDVTVFEQRGSVAAEASFAIGGLIGPGHAAPWGSSLTPRASMLMHLPWLWRRWRTMRRPRGAWWSAALHRLASFSRDRMLELARTLDMEFEQNPGCLVLLRTAGDLKRAQPGLAQLREWGVAHELVDAGSARAMEPGLGDTTPLHAALHLPHDGVGNCRQFAHLLKAQTQRQGARFRFDLAVSRLSPGEQPQLRTSDGEQHGFDRIVVCTGAAAAELLAPLELRLPLVPVYGYAVTAPLRPIEGLPLPGPRAALIDQRHHVSITRLGQRVRVAGIHELGGRPDANALPALRTLYRVLEDWFPGAASLRDAQHWRGARPTLPEALPVLGDSGLPGIWLNLGHGAAGWSLACGAARVLSEQMAGRTPPIETTGLTIERWR